MADDRTRDTGTRPSLTVEDCIRTGMYWFARSDMAAAQTWWTRALEIDPSSTRANECLRLLSRLTTDLPIDGALSSPLPTAALPTAWSGGGITMDVMPMLHEARANPRSPAPRTASQISAGLAPVASRDDDDIQIDWVDTGDPLGFAAEEPTLVGDRGTDAELTASPWDDGPSTTPVVTMEDEAGFDAVPAPTPLPDIGSDDLLGFGIAAMSAPPARAPSVRAAPPPPEPIAAAEGSSSRPAPRAPLGSSDLMRIARDRLALHDFAGALEALEQIPPDAKEADEARKLVPDARASLLRMYESKVGDFSRCPRVIVSHEELIWLNLNHRAGFILSQIDGAVSFEDLCELSGMPRFETVQIFAELIQQNIVG